MINLFFSFLVMLAAFFPAPSLGGIFFRQFLGLLFLCFSISILLAKKYHVTVGLCFLSTSVLCIFYAGNSGFFGTEILSAMTTLLLFSCFGLGLPEKWFDSLLPILSIIAIGDAVMMLVRGIYFLNHDSTLPWFMNAYWVNVNGSLDASFIALFLPIIWSFNKSWPFILIMISALLFSKSNTGIIASVVVFSSYLFSKYRFNSLLFIPPFSALSGLLGRVFMGESKFLGNGGRFEIWKMMMKFWNENANHFIGTGPGSFIIYAPRVQTIKTPVFPWMHNDWLQILFEQGYIGFLSVVLLFLSMVYKSYSRPVLFSMIVGYGVVALTQFPLHLFFFQLLGVALIYACFSVKEQNAAILQ